MRNLQNLVSQFISIESKKIFYKYHVYTYSSIHFTLLFISYWDSFISKHFLLLWICQIGRRNLIGWVVVLRHFFFLFGRNFSKGTNEVVMNSHVTNNVFLLSINMKLFYVKWISQNLYELKRNWKNVCSFVWNSFINSW